MRPTDKTKRDRARIRLLLALFHDALDNLERFDPAKARAIRAERRKPMDDERNQLAERMKRLEAAGDAMAMAEGCRCDDGIICKRCFERQNAWTKARSQP